MIYTTLRIHHLLGAAAIAPLACCAMAFPASAVQTAQPGTKTQSCTEAETYPSLLAQGPFLPIPTGEGDRWEGRPPQNFPLETPDPENFPLERPWENRPIPRPPIYRPIPQPPIYRPPVYDSPLFNPPLWSRQECRRWRRKCRRGSRKACRKLIRFCS